MLIIFSQGGIELELGHAKGIDLTAALEQTKIETKIRVWKEMREGQIKQEENAEKRNSEEKKNV